MNKESSEEYEWFSITMPDGMGRGIGGTFGGGGTLHYLEVGEDWKIYISEPPSFEDDGGPSMLMPDGSYAPVHMEDCDCGSIGWCVAFKGHEVAQGARLKTVNTAKRTALLILEALIQEPPEVPGSGGRRKFRGLIPGGGPGAH